MDFPDVERVIYDNNPLSEVVCQVRFPRILAIDERLPSEFQVGLGSEFPFVEAREAINIAAAFTADMASLRRTHYDFQNEARDTTITLCSEFVAVTSRSYQRWEHFSGHIERALTALEKSYPIPMFTRIGLRYVDTISREDLGLSGTKWSDLIKRAALGIVADNVIPISDVEELLNTAVLNLPRGKVAIRTGIRQVEPNSDFTVFVVDSDFFYDQPVKGKQDATDLCSTFNRYAGRAFRWFITDQLHAALGPQQP